MPTKIEERRWRALRESIRKSRDALQPFVRRAKACLEQYVGWDYSDDGASKPIYINLMELATCVYETQLAARPPQVKTFTRDRRYKPAGTKLKAAMNDQLDQRNVHRELKRWVKNSLYSMGIIKVCRGADGPYQHTIGADAYELYRTWPEVTTVTLDRWVHDMRARVYEECAYAGHTFERSIEDIQADDTYDEAVRMKISSDGRWSGSAASDRFSDLSQGSSWGTDEFHPQGELEEIWDRRDNLLITWPANEDAPPLKVEEFDGPNRGPYHLLYYNEVPGNALPLAPAMLWRGLHDVVNSLYRKAVKQADRQKTVGLAQGRDSIDAKTIMGLSDGEVGGVQNPKAIEERTFGGVNPQAFGFMVHSKDLFTWLAGNLDALGGLSPQADTLGQDKLMAANASQRVSAMQDAVVQATRCVLEDFGYYLWDDPLESYQALIELEGVEEPIFAELTPEERSSHSYYLHQIRVEPYSMRYTSPSAKLQQLDGFLQGIALPLMQAAEAQGITLNFEQIFRTFSEYGDLPEIADFVTYAGQRPVSAAETQAPGRPAPQGGPRPHATQHTNVRVNRPGSTRSGADRTLVNTLMGGNPQSAEQAGIGRPLG